MRFSFDEEQRQFHEAVRGLLGELCPASALRDAWSNDTGRVKVAVVDARLDEQFDVHVSGADALDAFHHPFAYAAGLGASFGDPGSTRGPLAPERSRI